MINLSSSPHQTPTSSFLLLRDQISKTPTSDFPPKSQAHLSKPFPSRPLFSSLPLLPYDPRISPSRYPYRRRARFRHPPPAAALSLPQFDSLQSVVEASAVLAAIIIVHEGGHFLAAYLQGIHVSKFAVGFGPVLAKFNANNVEYSIRAFPLGGFVGFPDNDPDSEIPVDDVNLLKNRPILDRVLVISAGVVANIIFAFVIIFVQVVSVGLPVPEAFPGVLVPEVRELSAAARAGVRPGDVILGVNGALLPKSGPALVSQVVDVIKRNPGRNVLLKVGRGNGDLEINITPDENLDRTGRIGVQLSPNLKITKVRPNNLAEAASYTWREFSGLSSSVLDSLRQTFVNFSQSASKVSGPVAIIAVGAEVAKSSSDGLYQFAAVLNINLAVINLLPLPGLDGGTLALLLLEAARGGKKIPQEVEQGIMSSGIMVVVLLGLFLIVRDTLNLDFIKDMLLTG
ncbi:putative membrane metalloprotease arasp2, chloroplastic [Asimina triloba]